MIKLSDKGVLKAEMGWKLGHHTISQVVNTKEKPLKEIRRAAQVSALTTRKQTADVEKVWAVWREDHSSSNISLSQV